jgi:solute carrier family 25 iron transporter 28/37
MIARRNTVALRNSMTERNVLNVDQQHQHVEIDDDWEEWDGKTPFWTHCVAGSLAGLTEHTLVYPLDTVRTHIQVCAQCRFAPASGTKEAAAAAWNSSSSQALHSSKTSASRASRPRTLPRFGPAAAAAAGGQHGSLPPQGMWQTMRYLMSEPAVAAEEMASVAAPVAKEQAEKQVVGAARLWRGVQTMMIGCIPAHALYFSSYEAVKAYFSTQSGGEVVWYGSMMAGATATLFHDLIMTPLDTVKQRLQLGHYQGSMTFALKKIARKEGAVALYRSMPITLFANLPYGMIMVSTNESLKQLWTNHGQQPLTLSTTLMASSMAGFVAAACTTPLDRIKTMLQTQRLQPACWPTLPKDCPQKQSLIKTMVEAEQLPVIRNGFEAFTRIIQTEGSVGLFRGLVPRVMSHTPAVAISWTTYETAKNVIWKITSTE